MDRDRDDELDPSDWLASQFEATQEVEQQKPPAAPVSPVEPTSPVEAASVVEPAETPPAPTTAFTLPLTQPGVAPFPPADAAAPSPPNSAFPASGVEPAGTPPAAPFTTSPAAPDAPSPAAPSSGQPFAWGLTPSASTEPAPPPFPTEPVPPAAPVPPVAPMPPYEPMPPFPTEPVPPFEPMPPFPTEPPLPVEPTFPIAPPASVVEPVETPPTTPLDFPSADRLAEQLGIRPAAPESPVPPASSLPGEPTVAFPTAGSIDAQLPGEPTVAMPTYPGDSQSSLTPPFSPPPLVAPEQHDPLAGHLPWEAPPALDSALEGATEVFAPQAVGLPEPEGEAAPASALESLFGDSQFREYDDTLIPAMPTIPAGPAEGAGANAASKVKAPRAPLTKTTWILIWVAIGLIAAIALVGLFFAGTKLSALIPPEPTPSATPTPTPTPTTLPVGPVQPGVYAFDELLGSECLEPFVSAWEPEYTVVDCATPHGGQLVRVGQFPDKTHAPYPGIEDMQNRTNQYCASSKYLDYALAVKIADLQVSASFAPDATAWITGDRAFYCFVNRSSGEPITGTVAKPPVAPVVSTLHPIPPQPKPTS